MKIGILGKFGPEEMGKHISLTLENMGYIIYEFEYGPYLNQKKNNKKISKNIYKIKNKIFEIGINFGKKTREFFLKKLIGNIIDKNLDILIVTHDYLSNLEIKKIKKTNENIKIILWFPDGVINVGKALFITAGYDILFFKCHHITDYLKNYYQLSAFYLGEAYNPEKNYPILSNEEKYKADLVFVGTIHSHRYPIIEKLVALGKYNIKIYGTKPAFYLPKDERILRCFTGEYATYEERAKIFKNAKINLNTLHLGEINGVNVRLFEIAGAGGFQLVTHKKEIAEFFELKEEIDTFSNFDELVEKIDFYLKNDKLRVEMAKKSYQKAKDRYTYKNRLQEILEKIKNLSEGDDKS